MRRFNSNSGSSQSNVKSHSSIGKKIGKWVTKWSTPWFSKAATTAATTTVPREYIKDVSTDIDGDANSSSGSVNSCTATSNGSNKGRSRRVSFQCGNGGDDNNNNNNNVAVVNRVNISIHNLQQQYLTKYDAKFNKAPNRFAPLSSENVSEVDRIFQERQAKQKYQFEEEKQHLTTELKVLQAAIARGKQQSTPEECWYHGVCYFLGLDPTDDNELVNAPEVIQQCTMRCIEDVSRTQQQLKLSRKATIWRAYERIWQHMNTTESQLQAKIAEYVAQHDPTLFDKQEMLLEEIRMEVIRKSQLSSLRFGYVIDHVPFIGNIAMRYNADTETFEYYAARTSVPFNVLETVAKKYVLAFDCKPLFIQMQNEMYNVDTPVSTSTSASTSASQSQSQSQKSQQQQKQQASTVTLKKRTNRYVHVGLFSEFQPVLIRAPKTKKMLACVPSNKSTSTIANNNNSLSYAEFRRKMQSTH